MLLNRNGLARPRPFGVHHPRPPRSLVRSTILHGLCLREIPCNLCRSIDTTMQVPRKGQQQNKSQLLHTQQQQGHQATARGLDEGLLHTLFSLPHLSSCTQQSGECALRLSTLYSEFCDVLREAS